jgi:3D (Asp-Asp-Asp) domain-containing protein
MNILNNKKSVGVINRKSSIAIIGAIVTAVAMCVIPIESIADSDAGQAAAPAIVQPPAPAAEMTQTAEKAAAPVYRAKARADGRSHIKITWSKVKDADGYSIYRSAKAGKLGKKIYTTDTASKKSYKDETASIGKKYWYTVKAWEKANGKKKTLAVIKAKKVKNSLKYESSFQAKTYAYSGGGTTASGKRAQVGRVAVDPNVIKLGTWLYIEDYGLCQAADTGGGIKGNKIDLYMDSTSDCYEWGVRHKKVYLLK